jgi:hypothetical protein
MTQPYATVILPTLDRASTLRSSLASVQAQTQADLEILVVLDGATMACREVAFSVGQADSRVRVVDLPKSRGDASESVDHAVRQAAAKRIFYIDDDDLWLPEHVARLGRLLEFSDVVDSRICSVDMRGRLHLGCSRGCNSRVRELLGAGRLKLIYDTHVAHRREAYGELSTWHQSLTGHGVWEFLAGLARAPSCKWSSHDEVTALSFHGAARRAAPLDIRSAELELWRSRLGDMRPLLRNASPLFHLFRLLIADPPGNCSPAEYFVAHGCYDGVLGSPLAHALYVLCSKTPPAESAAIELAIALSEPVEAGYLFESLALAFFEAYGQQRHEQILHRVALIEGDNQACRLASYSAALARRDLQLALHIARRAEALGPDPIGSLQAWREKLQTEAESVNA